MAEEQKSKKQFNPKNPDAAREDLDQFTVLQETKDADLSAKNMDHDPYRDFPEDAVAMGALGRAKETGTVSLGIAEEIKTEIPPENTENQEVKQDDTKKSSSNTPENSETTPFEESQVYFKQPEQADKSDIEENPKSSAADEELPVLVDREAAGEIAADPSTGNVVDGSRQSDYTFLDSSAEEGSITPPLELVPDIPLQTNIQVRVSHATDNQASINSEDGYDFTIYEFGVPYTITGADMDIKGVSDDAQIEYMFSDANTVEVTLQTPWNSVKNIEVFSDHPGNVALQNFVHADVSLGDSGDSAVLINGAKRGNITTGDGNDTIEINSFTNNAGWSNNFNIDTGDGTDIIDLTGDKGITRFDVDAGADNDQVVIDGEYYSSQVILGDGDDTSEGGSGEDNIDGGAGQDVISGGDGDDILNGGSGTDYLYGGAGDDTMQFSSDSTWSSGFRAKNVGSVGESGTNELVGIVGKGRNTDIYEGGDGHDTLNMTDGDDALFLDDSYSGRPDGTSGPRLNGVEEINAGQGNDVVDLTSNRYDYGDVTINGGAGNDHLWSSAGDDFLSGDEGNDSLYGGSGDDSLSGGEGNDRLDGAKGDDKLFGEAGDDTLLGGAGDDVLSGGGGTDVLSGGAGQDTIFGGSGSDVLSGGSNRDSFVISQGDGHVTIKDFGGVGGGGSGEPMLLPHYDTIKLDGSGLTAENMLLEYGGGNTIIIFEGVDDFSITLENFDFTDLDNLPSPGAYNIIFDDQTQGTDSYDVFNNHSSNQHHIWNKDSVTHLNDADNVVVGKDNSDDVINAMEGDDTIYGNSGDDTLRGQAGDDVLRGDEGDDTIKGGFGDDVAVFIGNRSEYEVTQNEDGSYTVQDMVDGRDGSDEVEGIESFSFADGVIEVEEIIIDEDSDEGDGDSGETIIGTNKSDYLTGTDGDDVITGKQGKDTIEGRDGDDVIRGDQGKDTLVGGEGDDSIDGGNGNDVITGNGGNDNIDGGNGQDTAVFSGNHAEYDITQNEDGSFIVRDTVEGRDGTDLADNIETFQFADQDMTAMLDEGNGNSWADMLESNNALSNLVSVESAENSWLDTVDDSNIVESESLADSDTVSDNPLDTIYVEIDEMSASLVDDQSGNAGTAG